METDDLTRYVRYMVRQLKVEGVKMYLKREVNVALVKQEKPDVLILAAGAAHSKFDLPGSNNPNLLQTEKLHNMLKFILKFFSSAPTGKIVKTLDACKKGRCGDGWNVTRLRTNRIFNEKEKACNNGS